MIEEGGPTARTSRDDDDDGFDDDDDDDDEGSAKATIWCYVQFKKAGWVCPFCTFRNPSTDNNTCSMCEAVNTSVSSSATTTNSSNGRAKRSNLQLISDWITEDDLMEIEMELGTGTKSQVNYTVLR